MEAGARLQVGRESMQTKARTTQAFSSCESRVEAGVGGRWHAGRGVDVELPDGSSLARLRAGGLLANESEGWRVASRCDGCMMTTWNREI